MSDYKIKYMSAPPSFGVGGFVMVRQEDIILAEELIKTLRQKLAEVERERDTYIKFEKAGREKVIELDEKLEKAEAKLARYMKTFEHTHINSENGTDTCYQCGLDLRDPIHKRLEDNQDETDV